MGRPLRSEWTKDITVHAIEEKDGEEVTRSVGFRPKQDLLGLLG